MSGSKTITSNRETILKTTKHPPQKEFFVWDGQDEDERPATEAELNAARETYKRGRGRPPALKTKQQVSIRFDDDVLAALRATGRGWQTRVNQVMREWLQTHPHG